MKSLSAHPNKSSRAGEPGFTLAEMLIAMGIFSMVIAAMVAVQLFGMRVYTLAGTKLSATAGCRKALDVIRTRFGKPSWLTSGIALRDRLISPISGCQRSRWAMP